MKNKKIIYTIILFIFFVILGTLKVQAAQEIESVENLVATLGNENIEVNENQIKLLNDIELEDNLIINSGNYIIDLNGKTISYTKNYATLFYIFGGNLTIKDDTNNGKLISEGATISCDKGTLKIENCKMDSNNDNVSIFISNEGIVQIDNGEFSGLISLSAGNLIINGGLFKSGLDVNFEPFTDKVPNAIINGGEFIGNQAGLYIWFSAYAKNIQLKGGTFKGANEETPGIYVGDKFDLTDLLPLGYNFDNDEQNFVKVENEFVSYSYTGSANSVSVERHINRNIIKLTFVDYDGNIIKTKSILQGRNFTLPEAPEKEGYVFVGWDIDTENVTNDMIITPIYEKIYNFEVTYIYNEYYTGEEIKPNAIIIDESTENRLSEEDYEIICENNINAGTASVQIQGKGKYKHCTQTAEFNILPKYFCYDLEVYCQREYEYTGEEIKPDVSVYYKETKLINNVDYTVSYESNINAGNGRIIVSGIGNYEGEITKIFRINQKKIDEMILKQTSFVYNGNEIFPEVSVKSGNKELIKDIDYTIYYANNINVGNGYIRINGINNYTGYTTLDFNIVSKSISNMNITIDLSKKQYTGKAIKPTIEIKDNDYKLSENFDYKVEYSNNINIGKATIKITGKNGYSGTITKTFDIVPKTVKITSIKAPIIRTVSLNWQKDTSVDGYEIYSSKNKEDNYSLVKTINRNNKDSHIFLAHKKGTYYYTMRSYKIVNGIKIYSDLSEVKEIKVR